MKSSCSCCFLLIYVTCVIYKIICFFFIKGVLVFVELGLGFLGFLGLLVTA